MEPGFRLAGVKELLAKERTFGAKTEGILTRELLRIGTDVARDASRRYGPYSQAGAAGVKPKVFTSGLWVVQTLRKSRSPTRQRPNFGGLMMRRAFLPAVRDNESKVAAAATEAVTQAKALYWE